MQLLNNDIPVVVTGGAGFLGQNVVKYLCERGKNCIIIDQKAPSMPGIKEAVDANKVSLFITDLMNSSSVEEIGGYLPDKFQLVHLAAVIETTTEVGLQTKKTIEYHCITSMNTFESWEKKLISACYISSWEVYGVPKSLPIKETLETNPFNVYGIGKLMTEDYLRVFCNSIGIPLTILRLSHIYGPGEWLNKAIPNFIKNCIAGQPHKLFGGGKDLREFVNARDVAYAIILSLNRKSDGTFNIAGGQPLNIRQILDLVQKIYGSELPVIELRADRPPLDLNFDLTLAERELGYRPQVKLEDGLKEEIDWFISFENLN